MPDLHSNQPLVVRDHLAVDLLLNLTATRRLVPFMHAEHTLGSAAARLEVPSSSLAYWVGRFRKAGLLVVSRVQPRAGKAIPYYRATAAEYRIPFEAMPPGARESFLEGGRRHMFERYVAAADHAAERYFKGGLRIAGDPDGGVELGFVEPDDVGSAPVTEWWGTVSLTADEAAEVHRIMEDVHTRFGRDRKEPGRQRYLMVMGLAPRPRGT